VGSDAGGVITGGNQPLVEGATNAAALGFVLNHDEADEDSTGSQPGAHGVLAGKHAIEDEGHVVVFAELEDSQHAASVGCTAVAGSQDLFSEDENSGFAGNEQETMGRLAAEPPRPVQPTVIHGAVKAVPGQGFGDEA